MHVNVYLYIHVIVCIPGHWASSKALCDSMGSDPLRNWRRRSSLVADMCHGQSHDMVYGHPMPWKSRSNCYGNPYKIRFDDPPRWWKTTHLLTPWFLNPMPQVPSAKSSAFSPFRYLASHGRLHVVPGKLPSGSLWNGVSWATPKCLLYWENDEQLWDFGGTK